MKNNLQISFVMEIFWLIVFILSTAKGIYEAFSRGFKESMYFFIISVLALLLYLARKNLRKKTVNKPN